MYEIRLDNESSDVHFVFFIIRPTRFWPVEGLAEAPTCSYLVLIHDNHIWPSNQSCAMLTRCVSIVLVLQYQVQYGVLVCRGWNQMSTVDRRI